MTPIEMIAPLIVFALAMGKIIKSTQDFWFAFIFTLLVLSGPLLMLHVAYL